MQCTAIACLCPVFQAWSSQDAGRCALTLPAATCCTGTTEQDHYIVSANMTCYVAESLPAGGKRKRVQTKLFGDDFVRDDLKPGRGPRCRKVGLLPL